MQPERAGTVLDFISQHEDHDYSGANSSCGLRNAGSIYSEGFRE